MYRSRMRPSHKRATPTPIPSGPRSRSDQNWDVRFAQLRAYQQEHGHTNVPKKEGSLGHWVAWQRKRNRQIQDGTRNMRQVTIWAEKRTRLDSIGFSWIGPHGGRSRRVPAELSEGGWRGQFQVAEEEAAECILAASAAFLAWILADGGGDGAARRVGRTASLAASLPAAFVRYLAGGPLVLADALQVCHDAVARSGGGTQPPSGTLRAGTAGFAAAAARAAGTLSTTRGRTAAVPTGRASSSSWGPS